MNPWKALFAATLVFISPAAASAQQTGDQSGAAASDASPIAPERWNLYYQATAIGDSHGTFNAPYTGTLSLRDYSEHDVSLTSTLFFTALLTTNTQLTFDPEIAGGKGFSGVSGIANPPNGELPRVATATPKPYLARLFMAHDFAFGADREQVESDANQLAGARPVTRYSIYAGRFSLTDYFDNNEYTHDPRQQFMAWGVMYNGAWDYPADTRGYTWGLVQELHTHNWAFRYAIAAEPRVANGSQFDRRLFRDHGHTGEVERRYSLGDHAGTVRLMGFANRADSGTYATALRLATENGTTPDVVATRRPGTLKYGLGVNLEQEIAHDVGVFMRLGWNDGKTESFAFTAIDRLATGGVSVKGTRWNRKSDVVATSLTASGVSGLHALYLSRGGLDFLIGDGRLNYAPEYVWESYYSARVAPGLYATFDLQHDTNLAFNHDRGPVWIPAVRLHMEFGLKPRKAE
ncbi:MAG: carbohydrate porin [Bryobacteraceae bacterium]|jgi:high affinity Mn2+ porin